jgi:predicted nucleotidyltransferase
MYDHERKTLESIRRKLNATYGARVAAMYAFGSRARGDHDAWSDFDVLVVVRDRSPEIESGVIGIIVDEELEAGLNFTPVIKDVTAFELEKRHHTPFYENVTREGVLV